MAQTDQQPKMHVHFRWVGSNAPIASLAVDKFHFSRTSLQQWLAPQLGLQVLSLHQVTLYFGSRRMTHDVLLGVHLWVSYPLRRERFMPHIDEAWNSFVAQIDEAKDLVVHVTCCSDADYAAAKSLQKDRQLSFRHWYLLQQDAGANNLWKKYSNNVAFMINAALQWDVCASAAKLLRECVFPAAPAAMQQNELFALATLRINKSFAELLSSKLWNKPKFAVQAALANEFGNFCEYLGPDVTKDAKTMLRLIQHQACYFKVAAAKNEFEFQCLAVSANHRIVLYLDNHAIERNA